MFSALPQNRPAPARWLLAFLKEGVRWLIPYEPAVRLRLWNLKRQNKKRTLDPSPWKAAASIGYGAMIQELVLAGCDEGQVKAGSMPEESLKSIVSLLEDYFGVVPIRGLHVGNFVGVSLTYLTGWMVGRNRESQMVSIDPNIEHRGIVRPLEKVLLLLNKRGLQGNSIILTGYSLEKSAGDDGLGYASGDPLVRAAAEISCERQLRQLSALCPGAFQFVVLDGNHDAEYFSREAKWMIKLLTPGGLIIVDDVCDTWIGIQETFKNLTRQDSFREVFRDGRIGVLQKTGSAGPETGFQGDSLAEASAPSSAQISFSPR
jgi:hypothetical protein